MTHYLRFPDAETGTAALRDAGLLDADDQPIVASHAHALDVIGPIILPGTYDPETGDELTPPVPLIGWHCNYVGDLPEGWEEFVVTPEQPVRVFAS